MDTTLKSTAQVIAVMLIAAAASQALYTALYAMEADIPRQAIWGAEGVLFTLLAAFAGSAMVRAKSVSIGWSAIFASALLNVVQVGVGLTMFGPFREAATAVEGVGPAAGGVVAYSFFVYNAAKLLLGLAALAFGLARVKAGGKLLGWITVIVGLAALVTNAIAVVAGRIDAVPSGAAGVAATVLLALCVWGAVTDD
ncbi:thiamine biosynthesis protein ThiC [Erythrobacter sp. MTPC3]|uniref:thiamine biosynthesis protein ThiC n=1 Tax=Erythrobacter sp. MTPC3 TaxID=3056564 RepID=UPI0036F26A4D